LESHGITKKCAKFVQEQYPNGQITRLCCVVLSFEIWTFGHTLQATAALVAQAVQIRADSGRAKMLPKYASAFLLLEKRRNIELRVRPHARQPSGANE
jgi:hypothetical protein